METLDAPSKSRVVAPSHGGNDAGDHDLFSHYITKRAQEQAILDGVPALALCGKRWLPTKDPQRYPVCPECKQIFESLPPGDQS